MERFTILVVDDDQNMHRLMKFYLSDDKYALDFAGNGRVAMHKLQDNSYHIIISDLLMPIMDGISFIKKLRAKGDETPIIVTSSFNDDNIVDEAMAAGADRVLEKPVNKKRLVELVERVLRQKHQISSLSDS